MSEQYPYEVYILRKRVNRLRETAICHLYLLGLKLKKQMALWQNRSVKEKNNSAKGFER